LLGRASRSSSPRARLTEHIARALATQTAWTLVYRDDAFALFARPGWSWPLWTAAITRV
jgi:hypothetical protein